jgi:cardiolipin synthase A/B
MRGLPILVLLVLVLPTIQPGPLSSPGTGASFGPLVEDLSSAQTASTARLLLTEICPGRPTDYVIITNEGEDISVQGLMISDGEGNITVLSDIMLSHGDSLALASDRAAFRTLHPEIVCLVKGEANLSWGGRFTLADAGDEVMLFSADGSVLDVVIYGSSPYQGLGWVGPGAGTVFKAHALVRSGPDTDGASDWSVEPPGRSDFPIGVFDAIVEPFSVPENAAERLLRELDLASRVVNCSVYEISDPSIVNALAQCSRRGLEVNVLIEGQPVGGLSNASLTAIATLQAANVKVRETCSMDSYKRYDFLHAKYLVLDARRVVVMSENWGTGLNNNRGWGACMDGAGIACYFDRVFEADFSGPLDVKVPVVSVPTLAPIEQGTTDLDDLVRYRCQVTTLLSPDYAGGALHELILNARGTVLVEQLSVDKNWVSGPGLVADLVSAAARGVKVRLLLDNSWGGVDNGIVVNALNKLAEKNGLDLEARLISDYHRLSVMHNKGLIVDDRTVISSINWGDSAVNENREAGVIITSPSVADHFADLFWQDWSIDPIPPQALLPWTYLQLHSGEPVFLDGRCSTDNGGVLSFEWDINGDGLPENTSASWGVGLPDGNNTILLTVRDRGNNTANATCWVEILPVVAKDNDPLILAALAVPVLVPVVIIMWKKIIRVKRH